MERDPLFLIVCLAILSAPFTGISVLFFLSISDIMILLGLGIVVYRMLQDGQLVFSRPVLLALCAGTLFLIVQLFTIPRAAVPRVAFQWTRTQAGVLGLFLLVVLSIDSRRKVLLLLRVLTVSVVTISVLTIFHTIGITELGTRYIGSRTVLGYEIPFRRTLGVPMDYGNFGMYLSAGISYLLFEVIEFRNPWAGIALLPSLLAALISQSRSTWAAIMVVLIVFLFYYVWYFTSQTDSSAVATLLWGGSSILFVLGSIVGSYLLIRINPLTLQSRLHAIRHALVALREAPIFGIGRYTYFYQFGSEVIHNGFINILVAYGLVGFLLFTYIYVLSGISLVRYLIHSPAKMIAITLLAALAGMTVELMFFDGSYTKILWIQFAVSLRLIAVS